MDKTKKSGFVAIIGRPNVGKSTLLNRLVGEKLAGVSPKPQTTRNHVRGIVSRSEGQIVYLDTPGLHDPKDLLGEWMYKEVQAVLQDADLLYWMVVPEEPHPYEKKILEMLHTIKIPIFLLVNQIDRHPKDKLIPILDYYNKAHAFSELIPISAKRGEQVELLVQKTFEYLPEGEPFFPEDQLSDQNERFIVSEIIREKFYYFTGEEIPYAAAVRIDEFKERSEKLTDISATIIVEKDSQKAIVIGKGGLKLKEIGKSARLDIEKFLGKKVYLQLWVKVYPQWKKDPSRMKELGYQ